MRDPGRRRIAARAGDMFWRIYGSRLRHPVPPPFPKAFLFVCKGNVCRSPFAEGLASRYLGEGRGYTIRSAGIEVSRPNAPPLEAVLAARSFGVDLGPHRSQGLDGTEMGSFDMVVAMEAGQFRRLGRMFPLLKGRIFLLPLFDPSEEGMGRSAYNILDPYGKMLDDYRECFGRIERCLKLLFAGFGR